MALFFAHTPTRDKIKLKWNSIIEEHMIEKCTILVDDMANKYGTNTSEQICVYRDVFCSSGHAKETLQMFLVPTPSVTRDLMPRDAGSSEW